MITGWWLITSGLLWILVDYRWIIVDDKLPWFILW